MIHVVVHVCYFRWFRKHWIATKAYIRHEIIRVSWIQARSIPNISAGALMTPLKYSADLILFAHDHFACWMSQNGAMFTTLVHVLVGHYSSFWLMCLQRLLTLPTLKGSELLYHFLTSDLELASSFLPDINISESLARSEPDIAVLFVFVRLFVPVSCRIYGGLLYASFR